MAYQIPMDDSTEFEIKRVFVLSAEEWERFQLALEAPPRDLPRLRKLMQERGLFDSVPDSEAKNAG
jgi:hypothetical protein